MKRLLPAAAILALLILPHAAQAQAYTKSQLAKVEAIFVSVEDQVGDGCLPSPDVLKVQAELILRQSGITVRGNDYNQEYILEIVPTGFLQPSGKTCIANIKTSLWRIETLIDRTIALVYAAEISTVTIRQKSDFQNHLRDIVDEHVTALANEILKARGQ